jgi:hypothetical protein
VHLDPDWVAAIGQVAGAIATVAAVVVALWIAARDRRQHERDRIDAAGRAAMVFARDSSGDVVVTNYGDFPVRDVRVRVAAKPGSRTNWTPNNFTGNVVDLLVAGSEARTRGSYCLFIPGQGGELDFVQRSTMPRRTAGSCSSSSTPRAGAGCVTATGRRSGDESGRPHLTSSASAGSRCTGTAATGRPRRAAGGRSAGGPPLLKPVEPAGRGASREQEPAALQDADPQLLVEVPQMPGELVEHQR